MGIMPYLSCKFKKICIKSREYPENTPGDLNSLIINGLWYSTDHPRKKKAGKSFPRPHGLSSARPYFVTGAADAVFAPIASLMTLMPAMDSSTDFVSDSRASSGLWKPSEFSAVQYSQRMWAFR